MLAIMVIFNWIHPSVVSACLRDGKSVRGWFGTKMLFRGWLRILKCRGDEKWAGPSRVL